MSDTNKKVWIMYLTLDKTGLRVTCDIETDWKVTKGNEIFNERGYISKYRTLMSPQIEFKFSMNFSGKYNYGEYMFESHAFYLEGNKNEVKELLKESITESFNREFKSLEVINNKLND